MALAAGNAFLPLSASPPTRVPLGRRVRNLILVWLGFSLLVGPASMPPETGVIGVISGVIAGVILLVPMAVVLGLIGGLWKETLVGGLWGLIIGLGASLVGGQAEVVRGASTCLIAGALAGATLPLMLDGLKKSLAVLAGLGVHHIRSPFSASRSIPSARTGGVSCTGSCG
jgi:hypothetical protein